MQNTKHAPSNRSFGTIFIVLFGVLGCWSVLRGGDAYPWFFGGFILMTTLTLLAPSLLTPLNRAWMKLGEAMHHIVSPIVLGVLYFGVFSPIGLVMRLFGRDALRRKFQPQLRTYWIAREQGNSDSDSLKNQF